MSLSTIIIILCVFTVAYLYLEVTATHRMGQKYSPGVLRWPATTLKVLQEGRRQQKARMLKVVNSENGPDVKRDSRKDKKIADAFGLDWSDRR